MDTTTLGRAGPIVSRLGLGCMGMSPGIYGAADDAESIATIEAAVEAGITLIDTGDFYGMGHNEMLLQKALSCIPRDRYFLSVKFGAMRAPNGAFVSVDTRPAAVKNFLAYTLRRLGTDYVDLYQPCRVDPAVPIEDTVGAIADMIKAGYVRYLGLSEASSDTVRRAHAIHPVRALQIEYSLASRGVEADILPALRRLGISMVVYGVFSRGLLTGHVPGREGPSPGDIRGHFPRFQGENLASNRQWVARLQEFAQQKGTTVARLALAWVLSRGEGIIPLVGARTRAQLADALDAFRVPVSPAELAALQDCVPAAAVSGDRYAPEQMAALDSERPSRSSRSTA